MRSKGKRTLFTAKDNCFVVMQGGETLYRGERLDMAEQAFRTGKPIIPSASERWSRTMERIIQSKANK